MLNSQFTVADLLRKLGLDDMFGDRGVDESWEIPLYIAPHFDHESITPCVGVQNLPDKVVLLEGNTR